MVFSLLNKELGDFVFLCKVFKRMLNMSSRLVLTQIFLLLIRAGKSKTIHIYKSSLVLRCRGNALHGCTDTAHKFDVGGMGDSHVLYWSFKTLFPSFIALLYYSTKMSENEDQGGLANMDNLTEREEYEDDFEKDLEWLINEEEKESLGEREVLVKLNVSLLI